MKDRQGEIEAAIAKLEAEVTGHERELANFRSVEETQRRTTAVEENRRQIESLMKEWEEIALAIEAAEAG